MPEQFPEPDIAELFKQTKESMDATQPSIENALAIQQSLRVLVLKAKFEIIQKAHRADQDDNHARLCLVLLQNELLQQLIAITQQNTATQKHLQQLDAAARNREQENSSPSPFSGPMPEKHDLIVRGQKLSAELEVVYSLLGIPRERWSIPDIEAMSSQNASPRSLNKKDLLLKMNQLKTDSQVTHVCFLLGIPHEVRPAIVCTVDEKRTAILDYCDKQRLLVELDDILTFLLSN